MARITLEDGRVINFQGTPTQTDIDEVISSLGASPKKSSFLKEEFLGGGEAKGFGAQLFQSTIGSKGLLGVAQQAGKAIGARSAIQEQTRLEEQRAKIFGSQLSLVNQMQRTKDSEKLKKLQSSLLSLNNTLRTVEEAQGGLGRFTPTVRENIGTTINAAATVAPAGRFVKGARLATAGREAVRGVGFVTGQALSEDRLPTGGELAAGAATGALVAPVAAGGGVVARKVLGVAKQVTKSLAGVLGVSVDEIFANPQIAQRTAQALLKGKETISGVLKRETETIVNGVRSLRQRLRTAFGEGLKTLKAEDINPVAFRKNLTKVFNEFGISVDQKTNERIFANVEFDTPTLLSKASSLIDDVSRVEMDGLSFQRILKKIQNARFKTTGTDPQRLSFNAFLTDLEKGVSDSVNKSTTKLNELNKAFSEGMQIVETMESEFGKVKFNNLPELVKASKKVEGLLKEKGIAEDVVDDFLRRIGEEPSALRATEAVRGAFGKEITAEPAGFNLFTLIRSLTAGVISPKDATRVTIAIARATNISERAVKPLVDAIIKLQPAERVAVIKILIDAFQDNQARTE